MRCWWQLLDQAWENEAAGRYYRRGLELAKQRLGTTGAARSLTEARPPLLAEPTQW